MSGGFAVDTETLRQFRGAVERARTRAVELRGFVDSAALAPGTFTRTQAGQEADAGHARMVNGIKKCVDKVDELLRANVDRVGTTIDNYETEDGKHAAAMVRLLGELDSREGFRL